MVTSAPSQPRIGLVATLGALCAVAPLGTDMFIPGLPDVAGDLQVGSGVAQLTVSAFLLGLMAGQLVFGPLSDKVGRRTLLLVGPAANALFSLVCALAPNIEVLIGGRVAAAFCGAAGVVLARAVITDLFSGPRMARYFAINGMVLGIAPIVAPSIGGLILQFTTWRTVFVVLAVIGAVLTASVWRWVPESLPVERRNPDGVGAAFRSLGRLLGDRVLFGYVLAFAFVAAAMFTYIASSSFVFQEYYGLSASTFSLTFGTVAVGMLVSGASFGALVGRFAPRVLLLGAMGLAFAGTLVHVVLLATVGASLALTWACLAVTMFGIGSVLPAATTIAQTIGSSAPGATSALVGTAQFMAGAIVSPLAGLLSPADPWPMAVIMLIGLGGALLAVVGLARPRRKSAAMEPAAAGSVVA